MYAQAPSPQVLALTENALLATALFVIEGRAAEARNAGTATLVANERAENAREEGPAT